MECDLTPSWRSALIASLSPSVNRATPATFVLGAIGALDILGVALPRALGHPGLAIPWIGLLALSSTAAMAGIGGRNLAGEEGAISRLRGAMKADLDPGRIEEEEVEVSALQRFRAPKQDADLLVFTCADGRSFAWVDDSVWKTDEYRPQRSSPSLGRAGPREAGHQLLGRKASP